MKNKANIRYFFILFIVLFQIAIGYLYAQNVEDNDSSEQIQEQEQIQIPDGNPENFQKKVEELNKKQEEIRQLVSNPQKMIDLIRKGELSKSLEGMLLVIRENVTPEKLKELIQKKIDSSKISLIQNNPHVAEILTNLIMDDRALISLAQMFDNRQRLYVYLGIVIFTFLMSYGIKKAELMSKVKRSKFEKFNLALFRFSFVNAIRMFAFLILFYKNLIPAFSVIFATLNP